MLSVAPDILQLLRISVQHLRLHQQWGRAMSTQENHHHALTGLPYISQLLRISMELQ